MNRYNKFALLAATIAVAGTVAYAAQGDMEMEDLNHALFLWLNAPEH